MRLWRKVSNLLKVYQNLSIAGFSIYIIDKIDKLENIFF